MCGQTPFLIGGQSVLGNFVRQLSTLQSRRDRSRAKNGGPAHTLCTVLCRMSYCTHITYVHGDDNNIVRDGTVNPTITHTALFVRGRNKHTRVVQPIGIGPATGARARSRIRSVTRGPRACKSPFPSSSRVLLHHTRRATISKYGRVCPGIRLGCLSSSSRRRGHEPLARAPPASNKQAGKH